MKVTDDPDQTRKPSWRRRCPTADADEIREICDVDGLRILEIAQLRVQQLQDDLCHAIWLWAVVLAAAWDGLDFPSALVNTCFAVRLRGDPNRIAGIVGFQRPNDPELAGGLNVYYWTSPTMRRRHVASHAVRLGTEWAFDAWEIPDAYIRATSSASERVAEQAGFKRTGTLMKGRPLFRLSRT
jgi:hypothetical protein